VNTARIGTIDFDIGCNDAVAVVTLDGEAPDVFDGVRLTQPVPCLDAQ
jgi:hypothetical protein